MTLHAFTTAGLIEQGIPQGAIRLGFNEPANSGNVWINVYTLNHWGPQEVDPKYLRAVVYGKLQARRFTRTKIAQYYDLAKPNQGNEVKLMLLDDAPPPTAETFQGPEGPLNVATPIVGEVFYLQLEIDGTKSRVPIQTYGPKKSLTALDLVLEVWAEVDGGLETQLLPLISLRPIDVLGAEVTFVAAHATDFVNQPETHNFPALASSYWSALADNRVFTEHFLTNIKRRVREYPARQRGDRPLAVLNIVCHGTWDTLFARGTDARTNPSETFPIVEQITTKGGERNLSVATAVGPGPLGPELLGPQSRVVLCACEIGNDLEFLEEFRKTFAPAATIYAPRYELVYRNDGTRFIQCFGQVWRLNKRGEHPNWPEEEQLALDLEEAYKPIKDDDKTALGRVKELYESYLPDDWREVAKIQTNARLGSIRFAPDIERWVALQSLPVTRDKVYDSDGALLRDDWLNEFSKKNEGKYPITPTEVKSFGYEVQITATKQSNGTFVVFLVGVLTRFKLLRLLTETRPPAPPTPVTPDLRNPKHYGRVG